MACQVSFKYGCSASYYVIFGLGVGLVRYSISAYFRGFGSVVLRAEGCGLDFQVSRADIMFGGLQSIFYRRRSGRSGSLRQASFYYRYICHYLMGVFLARFFCFFYVRQT